jgi:hypothetical protein
MLDRTAQALKDWRPAAAATSRPRLGWRHRPVRRQAEVYKKAATTCKEAATCSGSPGSAGVP